MPKVYRTMYDDGGRPQVGDDREQLGVRPPGRKLPSGRPAPADVAVVAGLVAVNGKGMSVFRSLDDLGLLLSRLVPQHLADLVPGAAGPEGARVWSLGTGPFESGELATCLRLDVGGGHHGTVCPVQPVTLAVFQKALADTRDRWQIDEP